VSDRDLRFSRWRRLPEGLTRTGWHKVLGPDDEPQRLTLYLPGRELDRATLLAQATGARSVQEYCEDLLAEAIASAHALQRLAEREEVQDVLRSLDELTSDPGYLAEWSTSAQTRATPGPVSLPARDPSVPALTPAEPDASPPDDPRAVVLRHAGTGPRTATTAPGILDDLRQGHPARPDQARELLAALLALEDELRGLDAVDRLLAFALHRLAFEGQLLVAEAWPTLAADPGTRDTLYLVQEAVDRILSGQDIRYDTPPADAATPSDSP
jgi:hypothetical protein